MTAKERVRDFIVEELDWNRARVELTDDLPLIETRVIDSLGIVKMIAFLESEFNIIVRDHELLPTNFDSVRAIVDFIDRKRSP